MAGSANITERGVDGVAFEKPIPASQPGDTFPAGAILLWSGSAPPAGWFTCDGSPVSRAGFPTLFTNIGTTWGVGDGSTTFNIPDFRDRVPVGKSGSKALASTGGSETHSISVAEMPTHNHGGVTGTESALHAHTWDEGLNIFAVPDASSGAASSKSWGSGANAIESRSSGTTSTETVTHIHAVSSQGSGTAMSLMQPYAAINYIIRAY